MKTDSFTFRAALATILAIAAGNFATAAAPPHATITDGYVTFAAGDWTEAGINNRAAFGLLPADVTPFTGDTLTITGGTGAVLEYTGGSPNVDGSVFAFRNIGSVSNLLKIEVNKLTFTGGARLLTVANSGMGAFGGGALFQSFVANQKINITDSNFNGNTTIDNGAGVGAGGGGLYLNNNDTAAGVEATLNNVHITDNYVAADGAGHGTYGGGLVATSFDKLTITNSTIERNHSYDNSSTGAVGGGIAIFNDSSAGISTILIENTTISDNKAESIAAAANGGGLWLQDKTGGSSAGFNTTLTNVNFTGNKVIGAAASTTSGGAIWTDSDLKIVANGGTGVLFSGNEVEIIGGATTSNSITSQADVIFNAVAASDTITDNDGFYVTGDVTKQGLGTLEIAGNSVVGQDFTIEAGTVELGKVAPDGSPISLELNVTGDVNITGSSPTNTTTLDIQEGALLHLGGGINLGNYGILRIAAAEATGIYNGTFSGGVATAPTNINVDGGFIQIYAPDPSWHNVNGEKFNATVGAGGVGVDVATGLTLRVGNVTNATSTNGIVEKLGEGILTIDSSSLNGELRITEGTVKLGYADGSPSSHQAAHVYVDNHATLDIKQGALLNLVGAPATNYDDIVISGGTLSLDSTVPFGTGFIKNLDPGKAVKITVDNGNIESYRTDGSTDLIEPDHGSDKIDVMLIGDVGIKVVDGVTLVTGNLINDTTTGATINKTGNGAYKTVGIGSNLSKTDLNVKEGTFIFDKNVEAINNIAVDSGATLLLKGDVKEGQSLTTKVGATVHAQIDIPGDTADQKFKTVNLAGTYIADPGSNLKVQNGTISGVLTGVETLTKDGPGDLTFASTSQQSTAGSINIEAGGLKTNFLTSGADIGKLNIYADDSLGSLSGSGLITVGDNVQWVANVTEAQLGHDIVLGNGSNSGLGDNRQNWTNIIKALDLGSVFYDVTASEHGIKFARSTQAKFSDNVVSAAYLHRLNTIYRGVNPHLDAYLIPNSIGGGVPNGTVNGQAPALCGGRSAWIHYIGRSNKFESSYAGYNESKFKTSNNGIQMGIDFMTGRGFVMGAMFGYEETKSEIVSDSTEGSDYYFGLYGAKVFRTGFDLRGLVGYGHQNYDFTRYGIDSNTASYRRFQTSADGETLEANIELGRRFLVSQIFSFRPFAGVDVVLNSIDGASEGFGGATYDKTTLDQLAIRLGSDANWAFGRFNANSSIAFSQQVLDDAAQTDLAWNGSVGELRAVKLGNSFFTFTVGANCVLNTTGSWTLYGNYLVDVYCDGGSDPMNTFEIGTRWMF